MLLLRLYPRSNIIKATSTGRTGHIAHTEEIRKLRKILIKCEAKKLLEGIQEGGRTILKIALIKSNGKCGIYIHLVQRADNRLHNTAINLHVP